MKERDPKEGSVTERDMMERYRQEGAQIHAPARLVCAAKEAMREEQKRQKETAPEPTLYARRYRRPLMAAAAAVLCLLLVGGIGVIGSRRQTGMQGAGTQETGNAAGELRPLEPMLGDASLDEKAREALEHPLEKPEEGKEDGQPLSIEKESVPFREADTEGEAVTVSGVDFWILTGEDGAWMAHAREKESQESYLIRVRQADQTMSREEFLERAYELFMRTLHPDETEGTAP